MRDAPRDLNVTYLSTPQFGPDIPAASQLVICWGGTDLLAAEQAVAPLLALPGAASDGLSVTAYADLLVENPGPPPDIQIVDLNAFAPVFDDDLIDAVSHFVTDLKGGVLMIRSLGGAFSDVPDDATAFGWRDSEVLLVSAAFLPPGTPEGEGERIRAEWARLGDRVRGAYSNFTSLRDAADQVYPQQTLERLRELKGRFDPEGRFRGNQLL